MAVVTLTFEQLTLKAAGFLPCMRPNLTLTPKSMGFLPCPRPEACVQEKLD